MRNAIPVPNFGLSSNRIGNADERTSGFLPLVGTRAALARHLSPSPFVWLCRRQNCRERAEPHACGSSVVGVWRGSVYQISQPEREFVSTRQTGGRRAVRRLRSDRLRLFHRIGHWTLAGRLDGVSVVSSLPKNSTTANEKSLILPSLLGWGVSDQTQTTVIVNFQMIN
jgi:hypothetical protein